MKKESIPIYVYRYLRILDAENRLSTAEEKLLHYGPSWQKDRDKQLKIDKEREILRAKQQLLVPKIKESDFEKYLSDRMCCQWFEFSDGSFESWKNSDNVIEVGSNSYQTQCTQYTKTFTEEELEQYFIHEYNS